MKRWQAGLFGVAIMAAFAAGGLGFAWVLTTFFSPETALLLIVGVIVALIGWKLGVTAFSGDRR
jgi:uncharacterized membrane protein (DUF441 family)